MQQIYRKSQLQVLAQYGHYCGEAQLKTLLISGNTQPKPKARCNCQKKGECPVPGECNQDGAIYQASVTSTGGKVENFKKRYPNHMKNLLDETDPGGTSLSKYFWREKNAGNDPKVTWKFLERNVPIFNPVTNKCRLCLREKFNIVLKPSVATLNSRQEIFAN
jgi:hypothetical protein